MFNRNMSNRNMPDPVVAQTEWRRRIVRASELGTQYGFAAEILRFYVEVARWQEKFYGEMGSLSGTRTGVGGVAVDGEAFARPLPRDMSRRFSKFLAMVEEHGPNALRDAARELREGGEDACKGRLTDFWDGNESGAPSPHDFFARAYLQPYAVGLRQGMRWSGSTPYICPFCKRKPGLGVLRPLGDGGQRSLVCSFCLAEWEFRRIVCPGCGEEDHAKLPVYTAEELKHVRVEGCDSCRTYIKTVDMTKMGRAEPVVDEMAAIPLDVWAEQQGYGKLQCNLLQL
jgi:FdhE protein